MYYSYEFKIQCIELYKQSKWPDMPEGCSNKKRFHDTIREWVRRADLHGLESLAPKTTLKKWPIEKKYALVSLVLAGNSLLSVSHFAGISHSMLHRWVRKYQTFGYNGLEDKKRGPKSEEAIMKKKKSQHVHETEHEELLRLREENEYMRTELAVIKKKIALNREKAAIYQAIKQQLYPNSETEDTN